MITLSEFKKAYSKAIQEGYAAIFAGAGLSKASGFVNWKELLNDLAQEIQLDVEKEPDLVEVAQYYCNEKRSRNEINEKILNRFVTESQESESIRILADLPIRVFWTTNYDHLLEDTLKKYGKRIDIKMTIESLATNLSGNDAVVYKMHGDYLDPSSCVILKDDYEIYNDKRQLFTTTLQGDLVSKTFLFIGFSFEDPNLKYILSRIRILLAADMTAAIISVCPLLCNLLFQSYILIRCLFSSYQYVHTYVVNSFSKIHPLSNRMDNLDLPNSSHHSIFFHAHENVPSPIFPSRCILYDRMAYIFPLPALYMMPYVI